MLCYISDLPLADDVQALRVNDSDFDLGDILELAITNLKTKNQRPKITMYAKFPCSVCDKNCNVTQKTILCSHCEQRVHRKCKAASKQKYCRLSDEPDDVPFQCLLCIMKENAHTFPCFFLDNHEMLDLNGIDLLLHLKLSEPYYFKSKLKSMPNLQEFDMDQNLINRVNSNYYDILNFPKIRTTMDSIAHGVPQGSVLGPLLFLMFINDLPNVSKHLTFYLFADDTNIYFESSYLSYIQRIVKRELHNVRKWLEANRLVLNINTINFVIFHSQRRRMTECIVLKIGRKIKEESYVKFLGIMLDSNLSWKFHLVELSKELPRTAGLFYKN